jgi:glycosyltransferase involved in cell wall biosynthesis
MPPPTVSVVTGVYNGERYLAQSLASVLNQEGVDFEFIVVDDGSTDNGRRILDDLARGDARLHVLHQPNRGLTEALIRGCAEARGRYIARHDADDLSLPGRLARQARFLDADSSLSMVASWARVIGPDDELLLGLRRPSDPARATEELVNEGVGPVHGSAMFRAELYRTAGGYRPAFRVAQDWDLWLRLAERGQIGYVPDTLYAHRIQEHSISARRRDQQLRLFELTRQCHAARRGGGSEEAFLNEAARVSAEGCQPKGGRAADNSYFIGKCLLDRRDRRALPYLGRCMRRRPWYWRYWAAYLYATVVCRAV